MRSFRHRSIRLSTVRAQPEGDGFTEFVVRLQHVGRVLAKGGRKQRILGLMDQVRCSTRSYEKESQTSDHVLLSMWTVAVHDWGASKSEV